MAPKYGAGGSPAGWGRPPGARLRPGDDDYPVCPRSCGTAGIWGRPGPAACGAGVGGPGRLPLKPLTIASVASAAATTWSTLVVTASDTRYLSGPAAAMTLRLDVFSVMLFSRYVPSMNDDGMPLKSASDPSVVRQAGSI